MIPGEVCLRPDINDLFVGVFGEAGLLHFLGSGARSPSQIERFIDLIRKDEGIRRVFGDRTASSMLRIVQTSVFTGMTKVSAFRMADLSASTVPFPDHLFSKSKVCKAELKYESVGGQDESDDELPVSARSSP